MLLTLIQEWEMVLLVTRKATWVVRNKHACNTLQPTGSGAAPTSLTPYFWQRCYRHLLSSQYTRVSITAEDLLDLVEWEREGTLHQKLAPLDPGPGDSGTRRPQVYGPAILNLNWYFGAEHNQTRCFPPDARWDPPLPRIQYGKHQLLLLLPWLTVSPNITLLATYIDLIPFEQVT